MLELLQSSGNIDPYFLLYGHIQCKHNLLGPKYHEI